MNKNIQEDDFIDLKRLFLEIWQKKLIIVGVMVLGWAIIVPQILIKPRRYSSVSTFVFKAAESSGSLLNLASMVGLQDLGPKPPSIGAYYEAVLFSNEFLTKVVDRKYLIDKDSLTLDKLWKLKPRNFADHVEYRQTLGRIGHLKGEEYVTVLKNKLTGVISLTTSFENPTISQTINAYIIKLMDEYLRLNNKSQATENHRFISARLEEVQKELRKTEEALLVFNTENLQPTSPRLIMELGRLRREASLNQELFLELKKQMELARIDELKDTPLLAVISESTFPLKPDRRGLGKALVLAGGVGLLVGIILVVLLNWFQFHFLPAKKAK